MGQASPLIRVTGSHFDRPGFLSSVRTLLIGFFFAASYLRSSQ